LVALEAVKTDMTKRVLWRQGYNGRVENEKVTEFVNYFERIRERSMRVVAVVPPDKIDWTYREGKFTLGDLLRHLGAIERWMFAENAQRRPSRYPGHGRELADALHREQDADARIAHQRVQIAVTAHDLDRALEAAGDGTEASVEAVNPLDWSGPPPDVAAEEAPALAAPEPEPPSQADQGTVTGN